MGCSNGSADALILGILSSCAAKCRLCARTPRKWGDVVLLQTCWCPLWVGVRCGAWSVQGLVCPAGELSYPEAWCLSAKVALLRASFPALFWGKWEEGRKGAKFCVLIGPNLVSCSVPSGTPSIPVLGRVLLPPAKGFCLFVCPGCHVVSKILGILQNRHHQEMSKYFIR